MTRSDVEIDVLSRNDAEAAANRALFECNGIDAVNIISSPGSGKTTLLESSVSTLAQIRDVCVVEGDQQTDNDAQRVKAAGARTVQVNTGDGCHLEAGQVRRAYDLLQPQEGALFIIENVGNLVCPTMFDLGETARVVLCSVTEGEDKPLKYPRAFMTSQLCLVTKTDLLPYLDFDYDALVRNIRAVNPTIRIIDVAYRQRNDEWLAWLCSLR